MSDFRYKHGLCVMRAQPFHIGHQKMVDEMLKNCKQVTIVLGSIQEQGTARNPFDYATRKKMIQNVYAADSEYERLTITGLYDIHNPAEWGEFVLEFLRKNFPEHPRPDVYYAGSEYDAHWFKNCFSKIELVDRNNPNFPFVSGTMIREMISFADNRWKAFVSPKNYRLIEEYFAEKMGVI